MHIVVGLGNPGEEYKMTRHNTGRLASAEVGKLVSKKLKVLIPDTFMNKTGPFVAKAMKGKSPKKLIVIYDDLDLSLGVMKISFDRGSGGHRGLESIIKALKTREFIRIRIGIGKKEPVEKHILGKFSKPEMEKLKKIFKKVVEAVETIAEHGLERAMTEFNQ